MVAALPYTSAYPFGAAGSSFIPAAFGNRSISENQGTQESTNASQQQSQSVQGSQSSSLSESPNWQSVSPILESIAQYAENMAPQVYEWGMGQWGNTQGNINQLFNTANTYASGSRLATDVGAAEAGVQQAGDQALNNSKADLESYGIDPSAGRYAALDQASRVQTAAAAAGAGNQQRQADIATSNAMYNQALSAEEQNNQFGNQVSDTMNNLLGTGMQLKYAPNTTQSQSSSYGASQGSGSSAGQSAGQNTGFSLGAPSGGGGSGGGSSGGGGGGVQGRDINKDFPSGGGGSGGGGPGDITGTGPSWLMGSGGGSGGGSDFSGGGGGGGGGFDTGGFGIQDPSQLPSDGGFSPAPDSFDPGSSAWNTGGIDTGGDPSGGSAFAEGGPVDDDSGEAMQGYDPEEDGPTVQPTMSPSRGQATDDVPARMNVGEFVMPEDVARWKGEEFFQNLIAKSRMARQSVMQAHGQMRGGQSHNMGGAI